MARLLALMGSGETSPTMVKTHRDLIGRVGGGAVLLDTPFGFQANADDLTARAVAYFGESVGVRLDVARFRSAAEVGTVEHEQAVTALRRAGYVFSGPGSPTYALRQWRTSSVPDVLREKLRSGGCVTFASAAALTLGVATIPVYEIYKVGHDPEWEGGLDLLAEAGLRAAVIPHYNNAEGGTHDTRFCYLGEARLRVMEGALPDGAFVLGVDEHTGCVIDLDAGSVSVVGLGVVTVRVGGRSREIPSGETVGIDDVLAMVEGRESAGAAVGVAAAAGDSPAAAPVRSVLLDAVVGHEKAFDEAIEARDVRAAVQAVLDLEAEIHAWAADTLQSDEQDRARGVLRSMVVRLGDLAVDGARDPAETVGPFVDVLLEVRRDARAARRFDEADAVRDRLVALGVEVRDTPDGTTWVLER